MFHELFLLRIVVAVIFLVHSIPKLRDPGSMASGIGWKPAQVIGLGLVEFVSALGLLGGIAIQLSSLLLMMVMAGAIYFKIKKWEVPFWAKNATGWEFDLLLLAANFTIFNYFS